MTDQPATQAANAAVDVARALRALRLLWAGLLMSNVLLAGLLAGVGLSLHAREQGPILDISLFAAVVLTLAVLTGLPLVFYLRTQCYKRYWVADRVLARGYLTGNVILFIMLDFLAIMSLMACVLSGRWLPMVAVTVLALVLHLLNFPHGRPMLPGQRRRMDAIR